MFIAFISKFKIKKLIITYKKCNYIHEQLHHQLISTLNKSERPNWTIRNVIDNYIYHIDLIIQPPRSDINLKNKHHIHLWITLYLYTLVCTLEIVYMSFIGQISFRVIVVGLFVYLSMIFYLQVLSIFVWQSRGNHVYTLYMTWPMTYRFTAYYFSFW